MKNRWHAGCRGLSFKTQMDGQPAQGNRSGTESLWRGIRPTIDMYGYIGLRTLSLNQCSEIDFRVSS